MVWGRNEQCFWSQGNNIQDMRQVKDIVVRWHQRMKKGSQESQKEKTEPRRGCTCKGRAREVNLAVQEPNVDKWLAKFERSRDVPSIVFATVPVLDLAGFIGLRGNSLTPSKIDHFFSVPSLYGHSYWSESLVFGIQNMQLIMAHLWQSPIFDIIKSQQVVAQKPRFSANIGDNFKAACWILKISEFGDHQKMHRVKLHISYTKH